MWITVVLIVIFLVLALRCIFKMKLIEKYLNILNVKKEKPTLDFLKRLIRKQLEHFPYENISKILFFEKNGARLQTLEEYLDAQVNYGYGGTCYPQNIYFCQLLSSLGFNSKIIQASVNDKSALHVSIQIEIDKVNFLVDFGFMDAFSGPFKKDQSYFDCFIGRDFKYFPPSQGEGFRFEIWDQDQLVLKFIEEKEIMDISELDGVIQQSFSFDTYFMSNVVLGRRWGTPCYNLRNREVFYMDQNKIKKIEFNSNKELQQFVSNQMGLPKYSIEDCFEIIKGRK